MRLDDFKGAISGGSGLALPTLFKVTLPPLAGVSSNELNMICKSVNLPGRQITSTDYATGTPIRKIANGFGVPDINMVFYVLNDHKVTKYFDEWQKLAHNQETNTVGYFDDYCKDVTIEQLQKGSGFSLFKKQLGFMDKVPQSIKNRLPDLGFLDLSQGEIDISLGSSGNTVRKVKLIQAYPTSVNDIQLGNDQNDQITELSIQLSVKDWEAEGGSGASGGLGDAILGGILGSLLN